MKNVLKSMNFEFFAKGMHKVDPSSFLSDSDALLLDVRSREEVQTLRFDLAFHCKVLHIPLDELPERLDEVPRDRLVGIFCSGGVRSSMAYLYLRENGFENVRIIEGGYEDFVKELTPGKLFKAMRG